MKATYVATFPTKNSLKTCQIEHGIYLDRVVNIPDWDCPFTVKAAFYEGLERNEHSMSPILWLGIGFLGSQA